jgi:hypothetical protein
MEVYLAQFRRSIAGYPLVAFGLVRTSGCSQSPVPLEDEEGKGGDGSFVPAGIYPFPGCKDTNYISAQCAANVAAYDAAMPGIVKDRADKGKHVGYVDMSKMPSDGLSSDGVHPNHALGDPWMGDNWYAAIREYLH